MADGGECVLSFLAQTPMYSIFQALSKTNKWNNWLSGFDKFASPYYDCEVCKPLYYIVKLKRYKVH